MSDANNAPRAVHLESTPMLDYPSPTIQQLLSARGWNTSRPHHEVAREIYELCRDNIPFGYNAGADDMTGSAVFAEGLGHCNTKATLLMTLLRGAGIPCRLRAFTIHKALQRGAMLPLVYALAPAEIVHTWAEAWLGQRWIALEGLILDLVYLRAVQRRFAGSTRFVGYGVACVNLQNPPVEWTGEDTHIQREGIARTLGLYDSPDSFYARHGTNLRGLKGWLYRRYFYRRLNRNLDRIRYGAAGADQPGPSKTQP
jgi:hypothetical protein